MKFRIKICGVTNIADAQAAADAGADAIGLNFYGASPRHLSSDAAQYIAEELKGDVERVGVFVNAPDDAIREICKDASMGIVQLHGDEPPSILGKLSRFEVIRARRLDARGIAAIEDDLQACTDAAGSPPNAVLIDAAAAGQYGGTGTTVDWRQLAGHESMLSVPLILAGGLTPENVAEAIRIVRPQAVDVASGVESSPGKKDHAKVRDFVAAAREAFAQVEGTTK
jgi:phosphoribosylanthranilate isomerase